MKRAKREYSLACEKLLASLALLEEGGLSPSKEGLYSFLRGVSDFASFDAMPLFGCLASLDKRRFASNLNRLMELGFIAQSYLEGYSDPFFLLTEEGREIAQAFLRKVSKSNVNQRKAPPKINYIPIERLSK